MARINKTDEQEVLNHIAFVYSASINCELDKSFFERTDRELSFLADYLQCTKRQALILSIIFTINYQGKFVFLGDLHPHFACNPNDLREYMDDFLDLFRKKLLRKNPKIVAYDTIKFVKTPNGEFGFSGSFWANLPSKTKS